MLRIYEVDVVLLAYVRRFLQRVPGHIGSRRCGKDTDAAWDTHALHVDTAKEECADSPADMRCGILPEVTVKPADGIISHRGHGSTFHRSTVQCHRPRAHQASTRCTRIIAARPSSPCMPCRRRTSSAPKRVQLRYPDSAAETVTRRAQHGYCMADVDDARRSPASRPHVATRPGRKLSTGGCNTIIGCASTPHADDTVVRKHRRHASRLRIRRAGPPVWS